MDKKKYDPSVGWMIADSKHFILTGEYEKAALYRKETGEFLTYVGDFYGEPQDGMIDWNEKYCVTVGCGIIVYRLENPFVAYQYHKDTTQWYEIGRDDGKSEWIQGIRQVSDVQVELTMEDDSYNRISITL